LKGRPVRVNQAENEPGADRGPRREGSFGQERSSGERKSYGERKSFGERKPFGEKSFGERKSFGEKSFGERKSFSDRKPSDRGDKKPFGKPFGEKKTYTDKPPRRSAPATENVGKGFGAKKSSEEGGDWKNLMNEPASDRKKKFGKKKW
jgi:hypothetical protein